MTRDPLDNADRGEPGLSALFGHLTSPATPGELAGEQAARAMFAAARAEQPNPQNPGITQSPPPHVASRRTAARATRSRPRRRPVRLGGRLVAACGVLALAFGFAAAGYAEVLPSPLQQVAHQILGFAGVPSSPGSPSRVVTPLPSPGLTGPGTSAQPTTVGSVSPTPRPGRPSPQPSSPRPSPHPSPRSSGHSPRSGSPSPRPSSPGTPGSPSPGPSLRLTITAAQTQIVAGASVQITASLTQAGQAGQAGQADSGVRLKLFELPAGRTSLRKVAHGQTGADGQLTLTVPALKKNASFLVIAPHGLRSARLSIVVAPPVSLSIAQARRRADRLAVSSPLARRGDVVELEVSSSAAGGQWQVLRMHRLRTGRQAAFTVVVRKVRLTYQVVLVATALHGESVSNEVTVAARTPKAGGPSSGGPSSG